MDSSCWVTVDHFTKDTYNQRLKFPNSLPRPILSWEAVQHRARESTLSSDPATHSLKNYRASGNRKATSYYSHIYTKHSQYASFNLQKHFQETTWKYPSVCRLATHCFPHILFCLFCTLCFVFCTFNVPGTIAMKLEVLQLKRYQDNEEIHSKHIKF